MLLKIKMQEEFSFLSKKLGFLARLILSYDLQAVENQSDMRNVSRATISGNSSLRDHIFYGVFSFNKVIYLIGINWISLDKPPLL